MKKSIVCDWLQLNVTMPVMKFYEGFVKSDMFTIECKEHGTQQFKKLFIIYDKETNEEVFKLAAYPRSECMMKPNSGILKIINKYLYQANLKQWVKYVLPELCLTFVNITRIDVTLDFITFDGLDPQKFINGFKSDRYLKLTRQTVRYYGPSTSVEKGKLTGGVESLKFGSEASEVSYQLYNKSLYMAKVEMKPWIMDNWKANGYDGKKTVWRLEFCLHSSTKGIVLESGEVLQFNSLDLLDRLPELFQHSFNRYFNFCYAEQTKKGNWKKQSRCEKLTLFDNFKMAPVVIKLSSKKDAGRSTKTFAKQLMKLNQECRGQDFDLAIYGNDLCTFVIERGGLNTWAEKKLPDYSPSQRIVDKVLAGRQSQLEVECMEAKKLPVIYDPEGKTLRKKDPFGKEIILPLHPEWEPAPF